MCAHLDSTRQDETVNGAVSDGRSNGSSSHTATNKESQLLIFPFIAFDENGVLRNADSYAQHLKSLPPMSEGEIKYLADLAYTLCSRRSEFIWRSFCTASTLKELIGCLESGAGLSKPVRAGKSSTQLGFVFTGQGAQWYAMGRELLVYLVFRESLEAADDYIKSLGSPWSLLGRCLSRGDFCGSSVCL